MISKEINLQISGLPYSDREKAEHDLFRFNERWNLISCIEI